MLEQDTLDSIQYHLNLAVIILPVLLALAVTINSRMKYRDKWSVCIMAADCLASEIYKFRMQAVEYDQSKPPGKDEDGNDLPPLSQKEKARRARMLFVDRVQKFQQACLTELSQSSSLKRTRVLGGGKTPPQELFLQRAISENKPTLAQWYKLKVHLEVHFHRTAWAFPHGVSFLNWMSALRPYLSQKTMKEEMKAVIQQLVDNGTVRLSGTAPLSAAQSTSIRRALALRLGLPPSKFDGVKDDIRLLQRTVVLQIAEEMKRKAKDEKKTTAASASLAEQGLQGENEELADDATMREMLMDMQGQGKPKKDEGMELLVIKKRQKKMLEDNRIRDVEDDYLAGPLSIDTYMCYRVRPVLEMLAKRANKRARLLSGLEILGFVIQSSGAIFGVFQYTEWVALTVAIAAVLQSFIEFMSLRDQVTSVNLALRDLQSLVVFWDSLSIVRRRTTAIKMQIAKTTEDAILMVGEAHTTAASNTITTVAKQMAIDQAEEDAQVEE